MARPRQVSTSTVKKSAPANTAMWEEMNPFQVVFWCRFGAGAMDNTVPMIRRRIECIELQWNSAGIDDVVIHPGGNEHGEARADQCANAIENSLARPFFHAKELIELVHFHPDLLLGH